MFEAVSKYLDLLKASGWQTGSIAFAAGLFLYLSKIGVLPELEPWMVIATWVVVFLCGALAAAAMGSVVQWALQTGWAALQRRRARAKLREAFIDDIPFLSERERLILGYLREKKQKTFVADHDGGYAATLLAKRYIYYIGVRGQTFDINKVPMAVAEHVWTVMQERPEDFPYVPEYDTSGRQRHEIIPWRIPWGAR